MERTHQHTFTDPFTHGIDVASIVENNVHACIGTILTGLHLLTVCTCTTGWYPKLDLYISKDPNVFKALGGAENHTSKYTIERNVRFNFPHPYCGGNLSRVDLAVLQLWDPWPLTNNFAVAKLHLDMNMTYYDYIFETKHLSNPTCETKSWWHYGTIQAPLSSSPPFNSTRELHALGTKVVSSAHCLPFVVNVLGKNETINSIPKLFEQDKICGMHSLKSGSSDHCGVDKGAPLLCFKRRFGWRLYGIGLGGTSCDDERSFSLFQGFSNSLPYMRLYLGMDLTLRHNTQDNLKTYTYNDDDSLIYD